MPDYAREIVRHSAEIEKCNQRGGRMLSVCDLIEAGTVSVFQAAVFMKHISQGASFIVGAKPGGAGKTTVMCALLNFLPLQTDIIHAENILAAGKGRFNKTACFLCHEIGKGGYYSYLWGEELAAFFNLKEEGHIIVTNLHADTCEEAKQQICRDNPVPEKAFDSLDLLVFLAVKGGKRVVSDVFLKMRKGHMLLKEKNSQAPLRAGLQPYIEFIENTVEKKTRRMEDFRKQVVDFLS